MSFTDATIMLEKRAADLSNCTLETCNISTSYWYYQPSIPANAGLLALFTLALLSFLTTYLITRRCLAFTIALSAGCILEIMGYTGRLISHGNLWHESGFLLQICCLTIAPAFMAAGVYMCVQRVIDGLGRENSRLRPEMYTRIFITCDIISLVLQALGGGMASAAYHSGKSPKLGDHIMVAGLAFQVLTLGIFICLAIDFAFRTRHARQTTAAENTKAAPALAFRFCVFLFALATTTICILIRSVYRVIELSEGWQGYLIKQQWLFFGLEGVMVVIAVAAVAIANPAFCFVDDTRGAAEGTKEDA